MGRMFRNEGISIKHNPEFTNIELYSAYEDYFDMMNITEDLIRTVCQKVNGTTEIVYEVKKIELSKFKRITMKEAIKNRTFRSRKNNREYNESCV